MKKKVTLQDMKNEFQRIGSTNQALYNENRASHMPRSSRVVMHLGMDWNQIIEACELELNKKKVTKEKLIDAARKVFVDYGYFSLKLLKKMGYYDREVYKLFGSIENLCDAANIPYVYKRTETELTNDELIKLYKKLSDQIGHPAKIKDINESDELPGYEIYRNRFKSINKLRELANLPTSNYQTRVTKEHVLNVMCDIYRKHGALLYGDLEKILPFSMKTLYRRFETSKINEIWQEVHAEVNKEGENNERN